MHITADIPTECLHAYLPVVQAMNPYQPYSITSDSTLPTEDVNFRNPIVTRLFSFVPIFLSIRSALLLTLAYAPGEIGGFSTHHFASGWFAWGISVIAATAFAIGYLHTLRHHIARSPDKVSKVYDLFGIGLIGVCAIVVVLPPLAFGST